MSKRNITLFCLLLALALGVNANPGSFPEPTSLTSNPTLVPADAQVTFTKDTTKNNSSTPLVLSIIALILSCGNVAYTVVTQSKSKKVGNGDICCTSVDDDSLVVSNQIATKKTSLSTTPTAKASKKKGKGKQRGGNQQDVVSSQMAQPVQVTQNDVVKSEMSTAPVASAPINQIPVDKPAAPVLQKQPQVETFYVQPRVNGSSIVLIDAGKQNRSFAPLKIVVQKSKLDVYFNEDSLMNNLSNIEMSILPFVETASMNTNSPRSVRTKSPGAATPQNGYWTLVRKPVVDII